MKQEAVSWNIKVSKETDRTVRRFLGVRDITKGQLSKFIEESVRWRVFHRTVQEIKTRNAESNTDELQSIVDDAVREVRKERRTRGRADKS